VLPGATKCDSPWMSYAKREGTGYGTQLHLVPSFRARALARSVPGSYEDMWADMKRCLSPFPDLPTDAQNTLYTQMVCHATFAVAPADATGGTTWDLEAWSQDMGQLLYAELWRKCDPPVSDTAANAFNGWLVHSSEDHQSQRKAWFVVSRNGKSYSDHILTTTTYGCLQSRGALGPVDLAPAYLSVVIPEEDVPASCELLPDRPRPTTLPPYPDESPPASSPQTPTGPSTTPSAGTAAPAPQGTVAETTGGESHTWTNYTNAGGSAGAVIPGQTTVGIRCRLRGFAVQDGNTWWYRVASAPWSDAYYASADAFYNNGHTSGTLLGTPYVDEAVPSC
jgi:hypothetical protein